MKNGADETTFGLTYYPSDSVNGQIGRWRYIGITEDEKEQLQKDELEMIIYDEDDNDYGNDTQKVANWIIRVTYNSDTQSWDIDSHQSKVIVGSAEQASFFFNTSNKPTDMTGYFLTVDIIKVLKTQENSKYNFTKDYFWKPYNIIRYSDGYIDKQKFIAEAYDGDKDSIVDVPTQYSDMTENL